jgi:hypothetical protein
MKVAYAFQLIVGVRYNNDSNTTQKFNFETNQEVDSS